MDKTLRHILLATTAALALGLAACEQEGPETAQTDTTLRETEVVDTAAGEPVPEGANSEIVSDIEDAAAGALGALNAEFTETTQGFAEAVAVHAMYEIAAAEIALGRSGSDPVRAFAEDALGANKEASDALVEVVRASNIPLEMPSELDARHQGMIDNLTGASDADFDARFIELQVNTHREALTLFEDYAQDGRSPPVRDFAVETVAEIAGRLAAAEALNGSLTSEEQL
jgi:putative membrane protein